MYVYTISFALRVFPVYFGFASLIPIFSCMNFDDFRYRRVEVPVRIVPSECISDACLEALEQLPDILGQVS